MLPTAIAEAPAHTSVMPAKFIALDIETRNADEKVVQEVLEGWTPPANVKDPAKIDERRREAENRIRERSALLDVAPVACVAVRTEKVGIVFNGIDRKKYAIKNSEVISCGDERKMLIALRTWLDASTGPETVIVGFNVYSFDLPKLRGAYVRQLLKLPVILRPRLLADEKQPIVDVMHLFLRWFTSEDAGERMISLAKVGDRLGLPRYKDRIDGADVPRLIEAGRVKEVLAYCAVDTLEALEGYMRMTSMAPHME